MCKSNWFWGWKKPQRIPSHLAPLSFFQDHKFFTEFSIPTCLIISLPQFVTPKQHNQPTLSSSLNSIESSGSQWLKGISSKNSSKGPSSIAREKVPVVELIPLLIGWLRGWDFRSNFRYTPLINMAHKKKIETWQNNDMKGLVQMMFLFMVGGDFLVPAVRFLGFMSSDLFAWRRFRPQTPLKHERFYRFPTQILWFICYIYKCCVAFLYKNLLWGKLTFLFAFGYLNTVPVFSLKHTWWRGLGFNPQQ